MSNFNIKVCRIKDIYTARYLARCGIDFLGLHAIFELPDGDQLFQYKKIISEIREYYPWVRTVLVTRIEKANDLLHVYKEIPTDFVQISSIMNIDEKKTFLSEANKLHENVQIFNVLSATESDPEKISENVLGRYIIIDKEFAGGTGEQIDKLLVKQIISKLKGKYILLAGGMGRVNINKWLKNLDAKGVDIMSSMEVSEVDKRKDMYKIHNYIKTSYGLSEIKLTPYPRGRELEARVFDRTKFSLGGNDDYECLIVDYDKFSFNESISKIRNISHFIPISIRLERDNFDNFANLNIDIETQNISSLCIYASDFLNNSDKEIFYMFRKNIPLALYIDLNMNEDFKRELKKYSNLFEEIYVDNSMSLNNDLLETIRNSNPRLIMVKN